MILEYVLKCMKIFLIIATEKGERTVELVDREKGAAKHLTCQQGIIWSKQSTGPSLRVLDEMLCKLNTTNIVCVSGPVLETR